MKHTVYKLSAKMFVAKYQTKDHKTRKCWCIICKEFVTAKPHTIAKDFGRHEMKPFLLYLTLMLGKVKVSSVDNL